jgi:FXSXX-COOH protein
VDDTPDDVMPGAIGLTEVDLANVERFDNPVLAGILKGVRDELEHPDQAIAGHDSSL